MEGIVAVVVGGVGVLQTVEAHAWCSVCEL